MTKIGELVLLNMELSDEIRSYHSQQILKIQSQIWNSLMRYDHTIAEQILQGTELNNLLPKFQLVLAVPTSYALAIEKCSNYYDTTRCI